MYVFLLATWFLVQQQSHHVLHTSTLMPPILLLMKSKTLLYVCRVNKIAKTLHGSLIEPAPPAYETLDMPGDDLSSSDEPTPAYSSVVTLEQDNEVEEISYSLFSLSVV